MISFPSDNLRSSRFSECVLGILQGPGIRSSTWLFSAREVSKLAGTGSAVAQDLWKK